MPHFQIVTTEGVALGAREVGPPDWPPGSVIQRGAEPNLRVVDYLLSDDPEDFAILVKEEARE